nr:MAG TPA: hypothetical protein [Caudoviricetes sp.]
MPRLIWPDYTLVRTGIHSPTSNTRRAQISAHTLAKRLRRATILQHAKQAATRKRLAVSLNINT